MEKEQVFTVKVYYINPIEVISVVIDALINMEYEVYTVGEADKDKLLKVIKKDIRNIIFFTVINKNEIDKWLNYIKKIKDKSSENIQMGAFVYDSIKDDDAKIFLENSIPIIRFKDIENNTLQIVQQILTIFEAKGKRAFIRAKTFGTTEAYFYFRKREEPVICKVLDISAYAFSIDVEGLNKKYFEVKSYLSDVLLVLQGVRIRVAAKVLGFSNDSPNIFILKFCSTRMQNNKVVYVESLPKEVDVKIHGYIRKCLKQDITKKLDEISDDPKDK